MIGKLTFDGSIERISCVTEHEDYHALTNKTVLLQVASLLKDKNERSYRRRGGVIFRFYCDMCLCVCVYVCISPT